VDTVYLPLKLPLTLIPTALLKPWSSLSPVDLTIVSLTPQLYAQPLPKNLPAQLSARPLLKNLHASIPVPSPVIAMMMMSGNLISLMMITVES
jgi:hypothetical protein